MKLWIDDLRPPPDASWEWAKSSTKALSRVMSGDVTVIFFDHDLGGDDTTMRVAQFIEVHANIGTLERIAWTIHSANPVGRMNIEACMRSADRFWDGHEASRA